MTSWSCTAGTSRSPTRDLVKGLAPLAAKTDRIDAWVLTELSRRELVPAIWLPDPGVRAERERARWRLHLVRHRTALTNRIHAILMAFGLTRMCSRCAATVRGATTSARAISWLASPSISSPRTSSSRCVNPRRSPAGESSTIPGSTPDTSSVPVTTVTRTWADALVDLCLANPLAHRLGRADAQLLRHRAHRLPLGGVVRPGLGDQAHCPLPQFPRIPNASICHDSILLKDWSLRTRRGGSVSEACEPAGHGVVENVRGLPQTRS